MLRVTSYIYDWDDPVHGSTDGWDPASAYGGHLGQFGNETVTLTVDDWAPHIGLQLSSGGLNAWGNNTVHEVKVYVGEEAVYRYFTYQFNPQVIFYDEEPLGSYATLGYIPHTDSQVQLRFEGSGFNQADQYDRWFVMMYSIHAVQPVLESLTVTNAAQPDYYSTVSTGVIGEMFLFEDASGAAVIEATIATSPDIAAAGEAVLWTITGDAASATSGSFAQDPSITLTPSGDRVYTFSAGVDGNGNGVLDAGEISRRMSITVVKVEFQEEEFSTFLNTRNVLGVTVTPASAASLVSLAFADMSSLSGGPPATFVDGLGELSLTSPASEVPIYGGNVYGSGTIGESEVQALLKDAQGRSLRGPSKPCFIFSLAERAGEKLEEGASKWISDAPGRLSSFAISQVRSNLEPIADPMNNDPRQQQAQQALAYLDANGAALLETSITQWWQAMAGQIKTPTTDPLELYDLDVMNLAHAGNVRGRWSATDEVTFDVDPIFKVQSISTIFDNMGNLGDIFSKPGLFIDQIGAEFTITIPNQARFNFELGVEWESTEPKWRSANPFGALKIDINNAAGGTLTITGGATYDVGTRDFSASASIQWMWQW